MSVERTGRYVAVKRERNAPSADRVTRSRTTDPNAVHLELNRSKNRPVRAILPVNMVSALLPGFDAWRHGLSAIALFSADIHRDVISFGTARDKSKVSVPRRGRLVIPTNRFVAFLDRFCKTSLIAFEANCLETIFQYAPRGVLLKDEKTDAVMNREYTRDVYKLAAALIFLDPPGSSVQEFHIDMHDCDRDAVWNMVVPLSMGPSDAPRVAASEFVDRGGREMRMGEATLWDACWNHQGLGNQTDAPRIYLHLLFVPFWMVAPNCVSKQWHFENEALKAHIETLAKASGKQKTTGWQYIQGIQESLAKEYNAGVPLDDRGSPLASWVRYVRSTIPDQSTEDGAAIAGA